MGLIEGILFGDGAGEPEGDDVDVVLFFCSRVHRDRTFEVVDYILADG